MFSAGLIRSSARPAAAGDQVRQSAGSGRVSRDRCGCHHPVTKSHVRRRSGGTQSSTACSDWRTRMPPIKMQDSRTKGRMAAHVSHAFDADFQV